MKINPFSVGIGVFALLVSFSVEAKKNKEKEKNKDKNQITSTSKPVKASASVKKALQTIASYRASTQAMGNSGGSPSGSGVVLGKDVLSSQYQGAYGETKVTSESKFTERGDKQRAKLEKKLAQADGNTEKLVKLQAKLLKKAAKAEKTLAKVQKAKAKDAVGTSLAEELLMAQKEYYEMQANYVQSYAPPVVESSAPVDPNVCLREGDCVSAYEGDLAGGEYYTSESPSAGGGGGSPASVAY
ncbi:MAG: hypothetical protein AB7P04_15025 [Bacteriovoracia bacterium]